MNDDQSTLDLELDLELGREEQNFALLCRGPRGGLSWQLLSWQLQSSHMGCPPCRQSRKFLLVVFDSDEDSSGGPGDKSSKHLCSLGLNVVLEQRSSSGNLTRKIAPHSDK